MSRPSPEEQIQFLVKIQRLFSEGGFVATYKFALLQALAALSVEKSEFSEDSLKITTREIAEKFISYYWRQTLPFIAPTGDSPSVLKQNTGRQAEIVSLTTEGHRKYGGSLARAMRDREFWDSLVDKVERVVRVMPLWKLQTVGREEMVFLYENKKKGKEIELLPGVAYNFRTFHTLIQDLIQGAWVRHIRSIRGNERLLGETADLRDFLFGSERENLNIYRGFLKDIQSGDCFYCRQRIPGPGDVDHFIPWVKYPVDLGHNFVLAHSGCNNSKRDYLAAENHLGDWFERNEREYDALLQFFDERGIIHDISASKQIACWAYEQASHANAHVWVLGKETRLIGTYWRNLCGQETVVVSMAADEIKELD